MPYQPAGTIACLEGTSYTSEPSLDDELEVYELKEETDEAPPLNWCCLWPDEEYVTYYWFIMLRKCRRKAGHSGYCS